MSQTQPIPDAVPQSPTDLSILISLMPPMAAFSGITAPPRIIKIGDDCIAIQGLKYEPSDVVRRSGLMRIAHRLKKLWYFGDRLGGAAFSQKQQRGQTIENPDFALSMTYTHRWTDDGVFVIQFIRNTAHAPCWVDSKRQPLMNMAEHEVNYFLEMGLSLFIEDATRHFQEILQAHLQSSKHPKGVPDYWRTTAPTLQPVDYPIFSTPAL